MSLHPNTNLAVGGGAGTIVGKVISGPACFPFLATAPADLGLSAAVCLLAVTLAGTVGGTAMAEAVNNEQLKRCSGLPDY